MLSVKNCSKFILLVAVMACVAAFNYAASTTQLIGPCEPGTPVKYAIDPDEDYGCGYDTPLPAGTVVERVMESVPDGSFYIDLTLQDGAVWAVLPTTVTLTVVPRGDTTCPGCPSYIGVQPSQIQLMDGDTTLRLQWEWAARPITYAAEIEIDLGGVLFNDCGDVINAAGDIGLEVETRDAEQNVLLDDTDLIDPFIQGAYPFDDIEVDDTIAYIDVSSVNPFSDTSRVFFVMGAAATDNDFLTADFGASILIPDDTCLDQCLFGDDGLPYEIADSENTFVLQFSTSPAEAWSGVMGLQVDNLWMDMVSKRITLTGEQICGYAGRELAVTITVTGEDPLIERMFHVAATYEGRELGGPHLLSTWMYNGTLLVAHWLNSNTDAMNPDNGTTNGFFKSRMYIFNHDTNEANVFVEVFKLPIAMVEGMSNESITGLVPVGTIGGHRGLLIRLEDVLVAADPEVQLPLIGDFFGNVCAVVTVESKDASGSFQVFKEDLSLAFGTAPMARVNTFNLWDLIALLPGMPD